MSKTIWTVYDHDNDPDHEEPHDVGAYGDAESAAEQFVDENWSNLEYPETATIAVVDPETHETKLYEVQAVQDVTFHAMEKKP